MTNETKLPVKSENGTPGTPAARHPFEAPRREVDRLFDSFNGDFWRTPFRPFFHMEPMFRREYALGSAPAVDIVEKDGSYEVTADVPGFDQKNIEVKLVNGSLAIKGERKAETEEKAKNYYVNEREFGSFERSFSLPEGVDVDKIEASLKKGVLTVTLPKKPGAQKPEKKIEITTSA